MSDASFMDGEPGPLRLRAEDSADLTVISALVQDAVLAGSDMRYDARRRQLAMMLGRFRWEDAEAAEREGRAFERVRSLLVVSDVTGVKSDGIERPGTGQVLSLLSIGFEPGNDGGGHLVIHLAGDGVIVAEIECIALDLRDVSRPYIAPSRHRPRHPD
ncbi:MAG: DUF2948 family protein [Paracoccus sp. (in: a-proteobacteria)]|nr:DUF2948 family protein [Paracoccus sp. (in: a-proteobacteria)]